jgi:hypothetical protein
MDDLPQLPPLIYDDDEAGEEVVAEEEDGYQLIGQLRRENEALKAQLAAFERKFIELQGAGAKGPAEGADGIVMLNVGGKHFSSLRSTLCR